MADEIPVPPAAPAAASTFLDQSEIDKLLAQSNAPAVVKSLLIHADGHRGDAKGAGKVETYDFRNPVFLSEVELRRLRLLHEDYIRYLSARLSLFLRMEFGLNWDGLAGAIPMASHHIKLEIDAEIVVKVAEAAQVS